jgi:hypothetical protein
MEPLACAVMRGTRLIVQGAYIPFDQLHHLPNRRERRRAMSIPLTNRAIQSQTKSNAPQAETSDFDFQTSVEIFVAAVLLTLYCVLRFPELGAAIVQYNQF